MQISIKAELLKKIYEENTSLIKLGWSDERMIKKPLDSEDGFRTEDAISIDLVDYDIAKLKKIYEELAKKNAPTKTCETISRWIEVLKDPMNGDVTSLQGLQKVFDALMKGLKDKWLFYKKSDGELCPVLICNSRYKARTKDDSEYFFVQVKWGNLYPSSSDDSKCYSISEKSFYFYKNLITDDDEEEFSLFVGTDSDFDYDDDDEDSVKKKPKKEKKPSIKLAVVLEKKGLFLPNESLYKKYQEQMSAAYKLYPKTGMQFTCNGLGLEYSDERRYYSYYSDKAISMNDDGEYSRIVIDNTKELKEVKRTESTEKYGTLLLPYHPYLKMYDLTKYRSVVVHVDKLIEYEYNENIVESLILPNSYKKLLSSLIGGENSFSDIVNGKSGGIIILGSGVAGIGKTLTAEVYSEVVKKPLYQIQSAQLGTKPEEIEKNLHQILRKADQWNAVLLIDECDAYVFQRGEDMIQNCVVGVFLRLLEYYKGILFLTTNRHDIIDGAIKSRLTAHIRYGVPSLEHQKQIMVNLAKRFNITISEKEQNLIFEHFPNMVGRDIRNLLKLIKKFYNKEKGNINLTYKMVEELTEFIPFVNN